MAKSRFPSLISMGAFLGAVFIHGIILALIYKGGHFKDLSPNILYAEIDVFEEQSQSLSWVEPLPVPWDEVAKKNYSYTKKQDFTGREEESPADVFMRLYESPSDFLQEKLDYEAKILAYAKDIPPETLPQRAKKTQQTQKASASSARMAPKAKISQGQKQSAYCQLGRMVSGQKPKKPAHVKILVSASGKVQNVSLTSSSGLRSFDNAALRMAHRTKCRPEIIKGKAKAAYVHIRISPS